VAEPDGHDFTDRPTLFGASRLRSLLRRRVLEGYSARSEPQSVELWAGFKF
jgi:hypothetical protein